eukprot:9832751-Ditylum_brightwellii.AAC.1
MFNNKQATFEEQMSGDLKHCLNAVTVHVFPIKAYKLQKQCIQHMMYKPRHVYLTEFSTPPGVEARKMDQEEILEGVENRILTSWKFQMDNE